MTLEISLNKKIATYLERRRPLMALQGARRAGKTYTACQWFLLNAYNDGDVSLMWSRGKRATAKASMSRWKAETSSVGQ